MGYGLRLDNRTYLIQLLLLVLEIEASTNEVVKIG
jgi:hypothetical protein